MTGCEKRGFHCNSDGAFFSGYDASITLNLNAFYAWFQRGWIRLIGGQPVQEEEMDAVWTEFFGGDLAARATVGVADLGGGALIEVVATALKG